MGTLWTVLISLSSFTKSCSHGADSFNVFRANRMLTFTYTIFVFDHMQQECHKLLANTDGDSYIPVGTNPNSAMVKKFIIFSLNIRTQ